MIELISFSTTIDYIAELIPLHHHPLRPSRRRIPRKQKQRSEPANVERSLSQLRVKPSLQKKPILQSKEQRTRKMMDSVE
jgi:hypothetical protein